MFVGNFNPLKEIGAAVGGVSGAIGSAAQAAAESASKAVADIGEGFFRGQESPENHEATEDHEPKFRYTGKIGDTPVLVPQSIAVKVVGLDAHGKPMEGRRQLLKMSKKGVQLLASDSIFSAPAETIAVGNCALFQNGKTPMGNPLLGGLSGGVGMGLAFGPVGAVAGAILGGASAFSTHDIWFAEIQDINGKEYVFKLSSRSDGDKLLEFLDSSMLA